MAVLSNQGIKKELPIGALSILDEEQKD